MKVKILCKNENYDKLLKCLEGSNFEVVNNDAEVFLIEPGYSKDNIIGRLGDEIVILDNDNIIYFEASGNDVICKTSEREYFIKEKLFELESLYFNKGFVRISKSHIINKKYIESIKPTINMKFIIKMKGNIKVEVTRTYYASIKEFIGI